MPRTATEFIAPKGRTRDGGLSPLLFQATRLSSSASLIFGFLVTDQPQRAAEACRRARIHLDRIERMTRESA